MDYYRIIGVESSPYSIKIRAVLRYRRIPYVWISGMPQFLEETKDLKLVIMPVVQFPDGEYHVDSTPIIHAIEQLHSDERSVIPADPAMAFVCHLIEDLADEWLPKSLFHYRFYYAADREFGPRWVMDDTYSGASVRELDERHQEFLRRQTEKMPMVGCIPAHIALLEESYQKFLEALEPSVALNRFLFGSRPSIADFALYGQLQTLARDPSAREIMRQTASRTETWTIRLGDTSGVEGEWHRELSDLPSAVAALLTIAGAWYLPYLQANAAAVERGDDEFQVMLGDYEYRQPTYGYHAKCRLKLVEGFNALTVQAQTQLQLLLENTDCWRYLQPA